MVDKEVKKIIYNDTGVISSWLTINDQEYFPAYATTPHIPTGLYNIVINPDNGMGLSRVEYDTDNIFVLPHIPYTTIVNDLIIFWNSVNKFKALKLNPHRGILLYGEAGCGKTSLIYQLLKEMESFNGIAIQFHDPHSWSEMIPILRLLENNRPIICIIKNLDKIVEKYGEEYFLQFLDGINSVQNIVYIATIDDVNGIPNSIQFRPSIFDRKYEVPKPDAITRKAYFKKKLDGLEQSQYAIDQLVKDTQDFTMAHLREFFVSVFIFNNNYEDTLETLRNIKSPSQNPKFFGRK